MTPLIGAPLPPETCAHLRDIPDYDRDGSSFISHGHRDLGAPAGGRTGGTGGCDFVLDDPVACR